MKRLACLLLAVFCTAFAQVRAVEPWQPAARPAGCCTRCAGSCGMPSCALPPAPAPWVGATESARAAAVAKPAGKSVALRRTPARFFTAFLTPAARPAGWRAPAPGAPAASVPLFKGHCRFRL